MGKWLNRESRTCRIRWTLCDDQAQRQILAHAFHGIGSIGELLEAEDTGMSLDHISVHCSHLM